MKKIEIKNRWTDAVIFTTEVEDNDEFPMRTALRQAYLADANLADANLADANLADANLADAYLADANLTGANLARAYLTGAYLTGANLARANLADAYLADANLTGAYLARAYLARAYLADANLADANLADGTIANLRGCDVHNDLPPPIAPNSNRPAERFFLGILGIGLGATPNNNPIAAIVDDWICEWLAERGEGPWIHDDANSEQITA